MTNEHSDEIDLIDLWLVITHHYRLLFAFVGIVFIVGLVVSFLRPPHYEYSATIQIGGIRDKSAFDLVEKPESVVATLQDGIIPGVLQQYVNAHPDSNLASLKIDVTNPTNSDVIVLKARGTAEQQGQITGILDSVIRELDVTLDSLLKEHVDASRKLLISELSASQSEIDQLRNSRNKVTKNGDSGSKALTLLLLDNQVSNLQQNMFNLKQQLEVGLVADIRMTYPVTAPQRSLKPVGLTRSLLVVLSLLCGLIFGLFAVFAARMLELARDRKKA